ncbi:MAG TPA: glycosyltransferase family 2 protein [Patescibacteria group bacterium]
MTKIAVIIADFNQPQLTIGTISSLKKVNRKDLEIHVFLVENGSTPANLQVIKKSYKNDDFVTVIYTAKNTGFSGGNNIGISRALKAGYDYCLLINNDTLVDPAFLKELLKPFETDSSIGIVGPKIYFAPGHEFHKNRYSSSQIGKIIWSAGGYIDWNNVYGKTYGIDEYDSGQYDQYRDDLQFISGCCLLVKSAVFEKIGLLSDNYFLYLEDVDFCYRTYLSKYKIAYQPTAVIWHINSGSTQSGGGSTHDYFLTRNRLLFGFRYAALRTKLALFRDSLRTLIFGTPWQKKGVLDYYFGNLNKGSWK